MNTELLKRWVAALRSGEYEQGVGKLQYTDTVTGVPKYCCLGVLQEIAPNIPESFTHGGLLNEDVLKAALGGNIPQCNLAKMNDKGEDFPAIADYIERKYLNNKEGNT